MRTIGFLGLLILAIAPCVHGQEVSRPTEVIIAQQHEIRTEIESVSGRYKEMPSIKRKQIMREQDKVFALLEGKSTTAELSPAQKTTVFNSLESISAAINNQEDERIVCTREKATGSNRINRVCKSVAQINAERERARDDINQSKLGICNSKSCSPNL